METPDIENPEFVSAIDALQLWSAPFGMKLLDLVEMKKHMRVLDLGCGLGFPLIELAQRLGSSCTAVGLDPWKRALERARLKIRMNGIQNAEVFLGVAEGMPFRDGGFDLIVSNNGVNNVQNMEITFQECGRVAKPGAQMVLTLNLERTMFEFYDVFIEVLKERHLENETEKTHQHIVAKRRPLDEIRNMLAKAGFTVRNEIHDAFRLRYADGTAMLNHSTIRFWFMPAWKRVLRESDVQAVFETVEQRLNRLAENKGGLDLTVPFVTIDCVKDSRV